MKKFLISIYSITSIKEKFSKKIITLNINLKISLSYLV